MEMTLSQQPSTVGAAIAHDRKSIFDTDREYGNQKVDLMGVDLLWPTFH